MASWIFSSLSTSLILLILLDRLCDRWCEPASAGLTLICDISAVGGRPCRFSLARIVARSSHLASFSCLSPASLYGSVIVGRSAGILTELVLEARDMDPRCRRCESRLCPFGPSGEGEAFEPLRSRPRDSLDEV